MIRQPYAAGSFYPGTAAELEKAVAAVIDKTAFKNDAVGLLVPHAGYIYSGAVAGAAISRVKITDTVIIIGPSHSGRGRPFSVMPEGTWRTPLGDVEVDKGLAAALIAGSDYLEADTAAHREEHAVEIQLPFLQYLKPDVKIVPMILSLAPAEIYRAIGRDIARTLGETGRDVLVLASGDMTHYEPDETAREKDFKAVEAIVALDDEELDRRYHELHISMCAYGPAMVLINVARELGAAAGEPVKYQTSGDATGDRQAVVGYAGVIIPKSPVDPLVSLAKATVETLVKEGRRIDAPEDPAPELKERAGVFVSIHRKDGSLRGCIGTFEPQQPDIAWEIITNAISSASHDPRFRPVRESELPDLTYSVDVLTSPVPVDDMSTLDPKKYGLIVESGWRRGLLLPDLEGVDTVEEQIAICRQKAGIGPDEPVNLYKFEVVRHK
jgi:AmmeMemoRadiSam system protein B/AmmeMemoRadiSam system protein A